MVMPDNRRLDTGRVYLAGRETKRVATRTREWSLDPLSPHATFLAPDETQVGVSRIFIKTCKQKTPSPRWLMRCCDELKVDKRDICRSPIRRCDQLYNTTHVQGQLFIANCKSYINTDFLICLIIYILLYAMHVTYITCVSCAYGISMFVLYALRVPVYYMQMCSLRMDIMCILVTGSKGRVAADNRAMLPFNKCKTKTISCLHRTCPREKRAGSTLQGHVTSGI